MDRVAMWHGFLERQPTNPEDGLVRVNFWYDFFFKKKIHVFHRHFVQDMIDEASWLGHHLIEYNLQGKQERKRT